MRVKHYGKSPDDLTLIGRGWQRVRGVLIKHDTIQKPLISAHFTRAAANDCIELHRPARKINLILM